MSSRGKIQSIYFPDKEWFLWDAKKWIKDHGFKPIKVTHEANNLRFRIREPRQFGRFVTLDRLHDGHMIHFVIGYP